MKTLSFNSFDNLWVIDFEFIAAPGEIVIPVCLVAKDLGSGETERLWLGDDPQPPAFLSAQNALFVTYFGSAEMGCFLSLGWGMPAYHLELFTEFRNATNGLNTIAGNGLLGALAQHGLASIAPAEKLSMRDLILSGGPWTKVEEEAILDYCQSDVVATAELFKAMRADIAESV